MTSYAWQVPSGWAVNGTVSTGAAIVAGVTVTITPTATGSGVMQFWALNNCNPALTTSNKIQMELTRTSSASLQVNGSNTVTVNCGASSPLTFNLVNAPACLTSYQWSMPSGWQDANGNAITSATTSTPSLAITPQLNVKPSNVSVTLVVNGSPVTADTYTETVLYNQTAPTTSISGPEAFCGASPVTYTVTGLTPGASASTFSVNTTQLIGSISTSSSGNTLTISNPGGSAYGPILVSASTATPCGTSLTTGSQPTGLRVVVGQPPPSINGFAQGMSVAGGTGPYTFSMITPSPISEPIINYNWNIMSHVSISGQNTANVSFTINPPPTSGYTTISMIVEYETACGWSSYLSTYFDAKPGSGGGGPPPPAPLIRPTASGGQLAIVANGHVTPATAIQGALFAGDQTQSVAGDQSNQVTDASGQTAPVSEAKPMIVAAAPTGPSYIKSVVVFNTVGQVRKKVIFGGNNTTEYLDVHDLPDGIYFLRIETTKGLSTEKYFIHR